MQSTVQGSRRAGLAEPHLVVLPYRRSSAAAPCHRDELRAHVSLEP